MYPDLPAALIEHWDVTWEVTVECPASGGSTLLTVLKRAYNERLARIPVLFRQWEATAESHSSFKEWVTYVLELEGWVYPERDLPEEKKIRAENLIALCDQAGMGFELTRLFVSAVQKPGKGAPIKPAVRRTALLALEKKRDDKKFSWMRFTHRNCSCPKSPHDSKCMQSIRKAARDLQALMRRLQIQY